MINYRWSIPSLRAHSDVHLIFKQAVVRIAADGTTTFPVEELRAMRTVEAGIDLSRNEMYLSPEDFEAEFGVAREAFLAMPVWRQRERKKHVDLF